ncbi:het domain protein [Colletotrichum asianum]|uniref:Het domain protein n=1 Tax=Colletotrichum asianum TaxID=702518 RepID=A0A8H3WB79_9PEZI|nr:het domain protein [Colletotrichum asianum]
MSTYNYRSLPPGCIRLLRLSPHEDDDAPIQCQLFEYSLASARRRGTHLYEALSYCWGSSTKSRTVFTDAGLLQVTENLYAALLRLRDPALERIIWADAICINQDDLEEKGLQVQLMAEVFARASCVIVWLESVTGDHLVDDESEADGRRAIRALEAAASRSMNAPPIEEHDRLAVEKLLGRPWFRRVWVVQEVAAARHVLILCRAAEIDGQAFCSGLNQIGGSLFLPDEDTRCQIRSTVNLIKGATLRSKLVTSTSKRFSLQISSLGYLIELHHGLEATDRRDNIYALLGMSTETPTGLVPDYQISWKDLLPRLVKSLLPESLSVTIIDDDVTALIRIRGCVVGTVTWVENEDTWDGQQLVSVSPRKTDLHNAPGKRRHEWLLQATSKRIRRGDIICLLQGASLPTIVRAHHDYCSIVAIAVDTNVDMTPITCFWHSNTQFEFLLTWSWKVETHPGHLDDFLIARGLSPTTCITWQTSDDLNTAVMLLETEQYYPAILKVHSLIIASGEVGESERPDAMAVAKFLDAMREVFRKTGHRAAFGMLRDLIGKKRGYVDVTEEFLTSFVSALGWEPVAFVLDTQAAPFKMTEKLLIAAIWNKYHSQSIMEVLLERSDGQINVTDKCFKAAMTKRRDGVAVIKLLLKSKAAQISLTEDFLVALAASENREFDHRSWLVMRDFLELGGDRITCTERVLIAAAANKSKIKTGTGSETTMLGLLLEQNKFQITITESVLIAAARNEENGRNNIELLLSQVTITENVVETARENKEIGHLIPNYTLFD